MIGRSNRGPSARPRVQSSNQAEEELPPEAGKVGRRIIHLASPAFFSKDALPDRPAVRGRAPELLLKVEAAWGGGEEKGCGKFEKKGRELPFPLLPPFSFYVFIYVLTYLDQ